MLQVEVAPLGKLMYQAPIWAPQAENMSVRRHWLYIAIFQSTHMEKAVIYLITFFFNCSPPRLTDTTAKIPLRSDMAAFLALHWIVGWPRVEKQTEPAIAAC